MILQQTRVEMNRHRRTPKHLTGNSLQGAKVAIGKSVGFNHICRYDSRVIWRFRKMRTTQQLSITLPVEMAKLVKDKVASGAYASESEVVREGLRALQERDMVVERWLREEVVPTYDRYRANAEATAPLDESAARLRAHMGTSKKANR
jgi:antitoxin ParD1/3/4